MRHWGEKHKALRGAIQGAMSQWGELFRCNLARRLANRHHNNCSTIDNRSTTALCCCFLTISDDERSGRRTFRVGDEQRSGISLLEFVSIAL